MSFEPLSQQSTAEVVATNIRDAILAGQYKPGDRLVEQELSDAFGTSRGPIREAMKILTSEGLINHRKNHGAVVSAPSFDDVLEVYAMRMSLGALGLTHAAEMAGDSGLELDAVNQMLANMRALTGGDRMDMVNADLAFQTELITLSGLPRVTEIFEQTAVDVAVFVRFLEIQYTSTDHQALIKRHESLVNAVKAGDSAKAVGLWTDHIRTSVREFMKPFSETEIEQLFDRPLMRNVFEMETAR